MKRLRWHDGWLLLPALVVLVCLDWHGLRSWFHQDDFAWLSLGGRARTFQDWMEALLRPAAQGTVRVFSERLFFLVLEQMFGLDHRPFHLVVLATQTANLALLGWITLRVSGSRLAAATAPAAWMAGLGLATPMAWLSAYNQVLTAFCLLAAFACLLAWLETGRRKWLVAQWGFFILGLGSLEVAVVYPALAGVWCWLERRSVPRQLWWMLGAAAAFAAAHMAFIPKLSEGVYARHWDLSMLRTYGQYWSMALGGNLDAGHWPLSWLPPGAVAVIGGLAAAVWLALAWRRGVKLAVFGFAWFTLALAPVLPLRDHVTDYYLALPSIGIAWMAATGLAAAWRQGALPLTLVAIPAGLHLAYAGAAHHSAAEWRHDRGAEVRRLYFALERAVELHPGKLIVVTGVDGDLFWAGFFDSRLLLPQRTCLDPREAAAVSAPAGFGDVSGAFCAPAEIAAAARNKSLAAYRWVSDRLHARTRLYVHRLPRQWRDLPPVRLDLASDEAARWLGPGWHRAEPGGRWMSLRAEATLAAPDSAARQLVITAYRPVEPQGAATHLIVRVDGAEAGRFALPRQNAAFTLTVPLPPRSGAPSMRVELVIDRPFRAPGDARELGMVVSRMHWQ